MDGMPGVLTLSPSRWKGNETYQSDARVRKRADTIIAKWLRIIRPIANAKNRAQLQNLLDSHADDYVRLTAEIQHFAVGELGMERGLTEEGLLSEGWVTIEQMIQDDTEVLDECEKTSLLHSSSIWRDVIGAVIRGVTSNPAKAAYFMNENLSEFSQLNLAFGTVLFVVSREIQEWNKEGIALLCNAVADLVSQLDDSILRHDPVLAERLQMTAETMTPDEVRAELGIPA